MRDAAGHAQSKHSVDTGFCCRWNHGVNGQKPFSSRKHQIEYDYLGLEDRSMALTLGAPSFQMPFLCPMSMIVYFARRRRPGVVCGAPSILWEALHGQEVVCRQFSLRG